MFWFWWSEMHHIYIYTCNSVRTKLFVLVLKCQRPTHHYSIYLKKIVILALKKGRHQFSHNFFFFCLSECKFTCASGKCLYLGSLICNQQNDCGDNSDEENCLLVTEHPPPGIFSCEYWLLVSIHVCQICLATSEITLFGILICSMISREYETEKVNNILLRTSRDLCHTFPGL